MIKRIFKRIFVFAVIACLLLACVPSLAFAVDPVSAGVMANAFAQAIAAYGASNGVSLTFDVANTDGIGESVHELWKDFREGTQSPDDYATLAAALFPDLYYKASSAVAGAADVYTVGYNISSEYAEEFDNFYNWLLSGPAEMTKVDNQYFEWSSSSPVPVYSYETYSLNGYPIFKASQVVLANSRQNRVCYLSEPVYCFYAKEGSNYIGSCYFLSSSPFTGYYQISEQSPVDIGVNSIDYPPFSYAGYSGFAYFTPSMCDPSPDGFSYVLPSGNTLSDRLASLFGPASFDTTVSTSGQYVDVGPYNGSSVAEFPDTADPNYDAIAKQIPSTYPWDDALYGDGSGILTDAEAGVIAQDITQALVEDGVIELVEEVNPPAPAPSDVVLPLLPVTLPSFNFSLSGIWHYVREWVSSLGAWFTTLFTIWGSLPYAMVVPVYATAVVVIVLGVYKRFFM